MQQVRLHGLDAVRAFALLLGVVLHATMSFWPGFSAQGWPIADVSTSWTAATIFYVIHMFRMTTFFLIAGFFAHMVVDRKGVPVFIKDRGKRIALPFVVGWLVCSILLGVIMTVAWLKAHDWTLPSASDTQSNEQASFGLTHLWFLYSLLWMYTIVLAVRALYTRLDGSGVGRRAIDRVVAVVVRNHVAPLLLALPLCLVFYNIDKWVIWTGIPTPDHSLIPEWPSLLAYGIAFGFGWVLHRQTHLLAVWQRSWPVYSVVALVLTVVCWNMADTTNMFSVAGVGQVKLIYAACYALATWAWTFAIIGAGMQLFAGESPVRRYVADSSYWVYIAHLPLVFALQTVVMQWPLHWSMKFFLILVLSYAILFLSYHYLVRSTLIGEVLNGRRYPRSLPLRVAKPVIKENVPEVLPAAFLSAMPAPKIDDTSSDMAKVDRATLNCLAFLKGVRKKFGSVQALRGLDLEVRAGELLAVLGPNGAGKTTAIGLLLGLQEPDEGEAKLFGQSPQNHEVRRRIGVMMQEVALSQELKVCELIELVASYYPNPYSIDEVLALTRTAALADRRYGKLSGGQKRQAQFALAVCGRPQLLFLDEPTVGLDVQAREMMWGAIRDLIQQGCSIVLTTHYLEEAEALADRVVVVAKGCAIAAGSVDEMRSLVSRRRISCVSALPIDTVRQWSGVDNVSRDDTRLHITASNAEQVVRQLLASDNELDQLEVRRAGLSEAFSELTQEDAQ